MAEFDNVQQSEWLSVAVLELYFCVLVNWLYYKLMPYTNWDIAAGSAHSESELLN